MGVMLRGTDRRANRKVAIGIGSKCQAWKNENEFANKQKRTILFLLPATALKMDKNPPSPHTYSHVRQQEAADRHPDRIIRPTPLYITGYYIATAAARYVLYR